MKKNILLKLDNITKHFTDRNKIILLASLIILLSSLNIFPTSALSYQSTSKVEFTINPSITISVSDLSIPSLSPGDSKDSNIINVVASSNATSGYTLYSNVGSSSNSSTELRKDGTDTIHKFTSLLTSDSLPALVTDNTWGYSYSNDNGTTWTNYSGLPLYLDGNDKKLASDTVAGTTTISFKIAAKASTTLVAGEYTNTINFIGIANPNPTYITLDEATYMQDNFSCTATPVGTVKKLIDNRDGQEYLVSRLPDGKCWMLDNLRLDPTNSTTASNMNETNTNATTDAIDNYLNPTGTAPQTGWSSKAVAVAPEGDITNFDSYTEPRVNLTHINDTTTGYGQGSKIAGVYYNYCAATVGTYCYENSVSPESVNASYDLCPANWRTPTGGSSGEYQSLCNTVYGETCINGISMTGTDVNSLQYKLSTPLPGIYYGTNVSGWGSTGYFWSSTRKGSNSMYNLRVNSPNVSPQYSTQRFYGLSMRCIHDD